VSVKAAHSGPIRSVTVAGAGAWGTALAQSASRAGLKVNLWGRDDAVLREIEHSRENRKYLPGVRLDEGVGVSADPAACRMSDLILLVVPAQAVRAVCRDLGLGELGAGDAGPVRVVVCAKGIELESRTFVTDIVREEAPGAEVAVLSGPSFAADVARRLPTAVTVASENRRFAADVCDALGTPVFRLYHTEDVRGVEIGGAAKNVLAIACGIADGSGMGASARAALIARGFAEIRRFAAGFGARAQTLMGLSGLGDLVLTCSSEQSRNYSFGKRLGQGVAIADALQGKLAEGYHTTRVLVDMAQAKAIDMPIALAVNSVLSGASGIHAAIEALMARPQKPEEDV